MQSVVLCSPTGGASLHHDDHQCVATTCSNPTKTITCSMNGSMQETLLSHYIQGDQPLANTSNKLQSSGSASPPRLTDDWTVKSSVNRLWRCTSPITYHLETPCSSETACPSATWTCTHSDHPRHTPHTPLKPLPPLRNPTHATPLLPSMTHRAHRAWCLMGRGRCCTE